MENVNLLTHISLSVSQLFLQLTIIATGNFNWYNLLTIALCLSLLDDSYFYPGRLLLHSLKKCTVVPGWAFQTNFLSK
jgi:Protein of unknown function (DUF1222).